MKNNKIILNVENTIFKFYNHKKPILKFNISLKLGNQQIIIFLIV